MLNRLTVLSSLTLALGLGLASSLQAQETAFNTFGPGQSYDYLSGLSVLGSNNAFTGTYLADAEEFSCGLNGNLLNIDLGLMNFGGDTNVNVGLYLDDNGVLGTLLESWSVTSFPGFGSAAPPVELDSTGGISMASGGAYWIALTPGSTGTWAGWMSCTTGQQLNLAENDGSGWAYDGFQSAAAFSVTVTPEPDTFAALGLGVLPLMVLRRKRSRK